MIPANRRTGDGPCSTALAEVVLSVERGFFVSSFFSFRFSIFDLAPHMYCVFFESVLFCSFISGIADYSKAELANKTLTRAPTLKPLLFEVAP